MVSERDCDCDRDCDRHGDCYHYRFRYRYRCRYATATTADAAVAHQAESNRPSPNWGAPMGLVGEIAKDMLREGREIMRV